MKMISAKTSGISFFGRKTITVFQPIYTFSLFLAEKPNTDLLLQRLGLAFAKGLAFSLPDVRLQAGPASDNNQLSSYRRASSPIVSPDSNKKPSLIRLGFPFDTATWARTKDLLLRRQLLYPTELLPHAHKYISFFADLCKGRKKVCRNDVPAARIVKGKTVFGFELINWPVLLQALRQARLPLLPAFRQVLLQPLPFLRPCSSRKALLLSEGPLHTCAHDACICRGR